ncbi:hypothetical protein [Trinickia acidisoli]|uniref:hypothetical protein n=1 Tax=Trinickia acidisoli TaxID=2767482 RepID=UPI001A8F4DC6|nr:hypothetical protein [Trinickia acidisoli]
MSLEDLIYRNRKRKVATATPATHEARNKLTVASVTTVAVAKSKNREAANDPASIPADCIGALQSADGGLYLPWGPYLSPDDARRMRAELVGMIEALADLECWPWAYRDEVLTAAVRGPLSALMPDLHHFTGRLTAARAVR